MLAKAEPAEPARSDVLTLALAAPGQILEGAGGARRLAPEPEGPLDQNAVSLLQTPRGTTPPPLRPRPQVPPDAPRLALAPTDRPGVAPLPWQPPRFARVSLLFQYLEDPRIGSPPKLGDRYGADLPPDVALAVARSEVVEQRPMIQIAGWCRQAGGKGTEPEDQQVALSDRLRLVLVEVDIEADTVGMLSDVLPVFGGEDVGFFHNRRPMMGGWSGPPTMARGEAWMRSRSNRLLDPNYPADLGEGGAYYFSADAAADELIKRGCTRPVWQGGEPVTLMGKALNRVLTQ